MFPKRNYPTDLLSLLIECTLRVLTSLDHVCLTRRIMLMIARASFG
jgi:hypothetical protein